MAWRFITPSYVCYLIGIILIIKFIVEFFVEFMSVIRHVIKRSIMSIIILNLNILSLIFI